MRFGWSRKTPGSLHFNVSRWNRRGCRVGYVLRVIASLIALRWKDSQEWRRHPRIVTFTIFRLVQSWHSGLLSDVVAGIRNENHGYFCFTGGFQIIRSLGICTAPDFCLRNWSCCCGTDVFLALLLVNVHSVSRSCFRLPSCRNCGFASGWPSSSCWCVDISIPCVLSLDTFYSRWLHPLL